MTTYFEQRLTDLEAELGPYNGEITESCGCATCADNTIAEICKEMVARQCDPHCFINHICTYCGTPMKLAIERYIADIKATEAVAV